MLNELWQEYCRGDDSDFLLGEIYAYVECLEVILQSEGADHDVLLDLEARYGIR